MLAWTRMVRSLMLSGLILLLAAPAASAGTREKILRECQSGRITGDYTPGQLRDARKHIPTDVDEYSDCRDVLARAALTGRGGGGGGAGVGSPAPGGVVAGGGGAPRLAPESPDEFKALSEARAQARKLAVDGAEVAPGAVGLGASAARHGLPKSLLLVVVLLGSGAISAAIPTLRRRVLAHRRS